jgi:flavin-dependent dehydrogenase
VYDVAVVGAGPAGAALARRLARRGRSVALLERSRFDRPRDGETLAPAVQPLLRDLGVWELFAGQAPLPSWGTRSMWGISEPAVHSHLSSGYSCGWHVDRVGFDRMLADAAAAAGACLHTGTAVTDARFTAGAWLVTTTTFRQALQCRVLVDTTGRRAAVARALGARRHPFDRLTAIACTWDIDSRHEQFLLVETAPDGWWYSAPLPDGTTVAMLMTDADLCRRHVLTDRAAWQTALARTHCVAGRVGNRSPRTTPRVRPAASHRILRSADPRPWLAVGDAALAVDPVSGSGVPRALRTAAAAADTVDQVLDRPQDAPTLIAGYERDRNSECTAFLVERAAYYAMEKRYGTPFWTRRQAGYAP